LSEQLGADPSPLTQQLHGRILNGEIETAPVAALASHTGSESQGNAWNPSPGVELSLPQQILLPPQANSTADLFVGRQREVTILEEALQQARAGEGSIGILAGEMGVGKSRLAYQVLRRAEAGGATVISATCQRLEQDLPYAPLADAIGRYLQLLPDSSLRRLPPSALIQLGQILPGLQDRLAAVPVNPEPQLAPEENRQRLIEGIVGFLMSLAQLRPLVLFLDDLHWADPETLAVVSRLSARISHSPFLLLVAYRQGDLVENEMLQTLLHALRRMPHSRLLQLERLDLHEVRSLISHLSGDGKQVDERLVQILYETTAGNALFLT
jgi:predicted ATPase